jgi:hypothetical protein
MSKGSTNVPEARSALDSFKYEVANEIGVPMKQGYNGDLTSKQNGSVGGYMVKNVLPIRTAKFERENRAAMGHCTVVSYLARLTV